MTQHYAELAFTPQVKAAQDARSSRQFYERFETGAPSVHDRLGPQEAAFIASMDSMFMATTSETGWPYIQHRGGPAGFIKVIDDKTIGFADYRGNRQYVSVGNLHYSNKVSLIMVDYAHRHRLKLMGRLEMFERAAFPEMTELVADASYRATVERAFFIHVEAFDWNCPQHITPRFTEQEIAARIAPLTARIAELEEQLAWIAAEGPTVDR